MQKHIEPDFPPEGWLSYSLGAERIGLVAMRFRWLTLVIVIAVSTLAAFGISRIRVDDSLTELFRANTPDFRNYEKLSSRFPSSEYDVLVVVEGPNLLARESIEALRNTVIEMQFVPGMRGLISIFSARASPEPGRLPPPLFPEPLPEGEAYDAFIHQVKDNRIISGKILSSDGQLTLIVVALDPVTAQGPALDDAIREIGATTAQNLQGTGLTAQLAGAPVMQLEIRNAVQRDRVIYNGLGFLIGVIIAMIFFRHISFMAIAAVPPAIAVLWSLGALGWSGFQLNLFLNVIAPLTMVMGFADSMQMTFALRDRMLAGDSRYEATKYAILVVGPACFLNGATAALSFFALTFADSALIQTFGIAGAVCMGVTFLAVILVLPLLAMLLLSHDSRIAARLAEKDGAMLLLRRFCAWVAGRVTRRPCAFAGLGLGLVIGFGVAHITLEPRYRLADQVPDREQAVQAAGRLDSKLTGANPVDVMIELPPGETVYSPGPLAVIAAVHRVVEKQAGVGNVWSVETMVRWLAESGQTEIPILQTYVGLLPAHLTQRFVTPEQDAAVVTGRIPDIDASDLLPTVNTLDKALDTVREAYPGYQISVSGLAVIAARNSGAMIHKINLMLTAEMLIVSVLIGLAFRSLLMGAVSLLPGLFPVVTAGASLALTGEGLQFASIIALTVAFGLGLNATIHYLNRLRLEDRPGRDPEAATARAAVLMGPALILTSIVLACGLAVTVFSDLPSLRLFGRLSATTLIAAMVGGLLLLPACMLLVKRAENAARRRFSRGSNDLSSAAT
ncbi:MULTISPECIES: MMPL family transporter [Rhodomicrobium]|uniref:efflux RND transporter permease subunit n=1 Tax=Rhodomicrobium TaxID=1068 RepID=UPI000B4AE40F|nr:MULTISPECIES: MMPL family transporter [Rhodomicrobium]